jgi:hypothetical protein
MLGDQILSPIIDWNLGDPMNINGPKQRCNELIILPSIHQNNKRVFSSRTFLALATVALLFVFVN